MSSFMYDSKVNQKLRTIIQMAWFKMYKNRFKDLGVRSASSPSPDGLTILPGKWEIDAHTSEGERTWMECSCDFLHSKLDEEIRELKEAARDPAMTNQDILWEAGDVTALATFVADHAHAFEGSLLQPPIVCLCGSTKFKAEWEKAILELTLQGTIVLSVGAFGHADEISFSVEQKTRLDVLHFRKIDLADEILVINKDGYIGQSCRNEINYAKSTGKPVFYVYPEFEDKGNYIGTYPKQAI